MVCTRAVSFVCEAYACSTNGKEELLTIDEHMHTSHEVQVIFVIIQKMLTRLSNLAKVEGEDPEGCSTNRNTSVTVEECFVWHMIGIYARCVLWKDRR